LFFLKLIDLHVPKNLEVHLVLCERSVSLAVCDH
jgi:hypothetical protein